MTGFEVVSLVVGIVGVLAGSFAIPAFALMWSQSTEEHKQRYRQLWARLGQKMYRGWVYLSCAALVATGVAKVVEFVTSSDPITRLDIFLLLVNLMSLAVFSGVSLVLFVHFQLMDKRNSALSKVTTP